MNFKALVYLILISTIYSQDWNMQNDITKEISQKLGKDIWTNIFLEY